MYSSRAAQRKRRYLNRPTQGRFSGDYCAFPFRFSSTFPLSFTSPSCFISFPASFPSLRSLFCPPFSHLSSFSLPLPALSTPDCPPSTSSPVFFRFPSCAFLPVPFTSLPFSPTLHSHPHSVAVFSHFLPCKRGVHE